MRVRSLVVVGAVLSALLATAPTAQADIGVHCGGWEQTSEWGVMGNACYLRSSLWVVRGRGKVYYTGYRKVTYLAAVVQLQKSLNGVNGWELIKSNVCGWYGDELEDEAPGNICNTALVNVDAGYIYRTRLLVKVYYADGTSELTDPIYSGITT